MLICWRSVCFRPGEGALPEYFDVELAPRREAGRFAGRARASLRVGLAAGLVRQECSHRKRRAASGRSFDHRVADSLFEFAGNVGASSRARGLVVNGVWSDGARRGMAAFGYGRKPSGSRRWHGVKSADARTIAPPARRRRSDRHLRGCTATGCGLKGWTPADMALAEIAAPATSLYHLTGALTDDAVVALAG